MSNPIFPQIRRATLRERGYHMTEQDLKAKNALILLEAHDQEALFTVAEDDYRKMAVEIEGLARLMKERKRDISIDVYETMFDSRLFRKTLEDYTKAADERDRLKELISKI
jgi:hypothetical protein